MLTLRAKLEVAAGALVIAGVIFGHSIWLAEHDEKLRAQAEIAAAKRAFDQLAVDRRSHEDADRARDEATAKQLQAMQKLAAQVQTPAQIASWIPKQLSVPQPITIAVPTPTAQDPHPNAVASIPQVDLPALRDAIENCKETALRLSRCAQDLASRDAQIKMADAQIEELKKGNQALETELKGGTFWRRAKKTLKVAACAGAGGPAGQWRERKTATWLSARSDARHLSS
jgi:hypothetical protein